MFVVCVFLNAVVVIYVLGVGCRPLLVCCLFLDVRCSLFVVGCYSLFAAG